MSLQSINELKGGRKMKGIRKHKGIIQIGNNKGKLKKGYRYTCKKTKTGLPIIIGGGIYNLNHDAKQSMEKIQQY